MVIAQHAVVVAHAPGQASVLLVLHPQVVNDLVDHVSVELVDGFGVLGIGALGPVDLLGDVVLALGKVRFESVVVDLSLHGRRSHHL